MQRSEFQISTIRGREPRLGYVFGHFAYHRAGAEDSYPRGRWIVTHVPTGLAATNARSAKHARALCRMLAEDLGDNVASDDVSEVVWVMKNAQSFGPLIAVRHDVDPTSPHALDPMWRRQGGAR